MAADGGAPRVYVHAFLDGRDTPPKSAGPSLAFLQDVCAGFAGARIASICGRYYAMDRDKRWERIQAAYDLLVDGRAAYSAPDPQPALAAAYARGETDEFVQATAILDAEGRAATMADGDVVVFMNFRADRARQITRALIDPAFDGFARTPRAAARASSASPGTATSSPICRSPSRPQSVANSFGDYLARARPAQLRIAETEKYAHVTYFFSGGVEPSIPARTASWCLRRGWRPTICSPR